MGMNRIEIAVAFLNFPSSQLSNPLTLDICEKVRLVLKKLKLIPDNGQRQNRYR
jgi:hypothetical protein